MKHRSNNNYIPVIASDVNGVHAPAMWIEVDPKDKKKYAKAIKEGKERSSLSRYPGWSFR